MATRRLHTKSLVRISTDLAGEQVISEFDIEQDDDSITFIKGPVDVTLAGGAAATEVTKPIGATTIRFIAVHYVSTTTGINLRLGGAGNDPVLVLPPTGTSKKGYFEVYTSTTSLHVDNPDATASVSASIIMGCV